MKNSVKNILFILVYIFASSLSGFCQEEVRINRSKKVFFKQESKKTEVVVKSTGDYNYLVIRLHCELQEGDLKMEILDPEGNVEGTFTVKSDEATVVGDSTIVNERVSGIMSKVFGHPKKGEWVLRASPSSAKGSLSIDITQGWEPRIDMINLQELKLR